MSKSILGVITAAMLVIGCQSEPPSASVDVDDDDIGGVVTSTNGAEAGIWVIAETDDFDTMFARIVVTDDEGRYLVPDLPASRETSSPPSETGPTKRPSFGTRTPALQNVIKSDHARFLLRRGRFHSSMS